MFSDNCPLSVCCALFLCSFGQFSHYLLAHFDQHRGQCAELLSYWRLVGGDKLSMADEYFTAVRMMEEGDFLIEFYLSVDTCFCF